MPKPYRGYPKGTILRFEPSENAFSALAKTRVEVVRRFVWAKRNGKPERFPGDPTTFTDSFAYVCIPLDAPKGHYPNGIVALESELSAMTSETELAWPCYSPKTFPLR